MKINEIFYSLQGEGTWTGLPNIFIRATNCNLRCSFCDTKYAYEEGTEMTIPEIMNDIKKYSCTRVCLTGGEPLLQKDTFPLLDTLAKKNYITCVETNGSLSIQPLVKRKEILISLDIKCPSSQMHTKMDMKNLSLLRTQDQLKIVIQNKEDYKYAKTVIKKYKTKGAIFFQPVWNSLQPSQLAEWILNDGLPVKLGLQLHKIVFGDKKGI